MHIATIDIEDIFNPIMVDFILTKCLRKTGLNSYLKFHHFENDIYFIEINCGQYQSGHRNRLYKKDIFKSSGEIRKKELVITYDREKGIQLTTQPQ